MISKRLFYFQLYVLWVNCKLITATSARSATKHTASLTSQCKDDIPPPLPTPSTCIIQLTLHLSLTIIALGLDPRPGGTWAIGCGVTAVTRWAQFTGTAAWRIIQVGGGGGGGTGLLLVLVRVVGMGVAVAVATFVLSDGEQGLQGVGGVVVLHGERVAVVGAGGLALQPAGSGDESFTFQNTPPTPKKSKNHSHYLQNSEATRYGSQCR
jgi:hypothetical protein